MFTLTNTTTLKIPRTSFQAIKDAALGKKYHLTVSVVSASHIKKLNLMYRNKNEATDILSFPLSATEGEIYMCPSESRKEAKKFDRSFENFLPFLFIHGCVHLIGHDHGSTMGHIEAKLRKKFAV